MISNLSRVEQYDSALKLAANHTNAVKHDQNCEFGRFTFNSHSSHRLQHENAQLYLNKRVFTVKCGN